MEWISVKDKLPENGQRVIAFCSSTKKTFVALFESNSDYKSVYWWHEGARNALYCVVSKVTHWMPLPEPPKSN